VAEAALNGEEFNAAPKPERNRQERGERAERNERGERGEGRRERQNRNADAQPAMQAVADEAALNTAQVEGSDAQVQDGAQGGEAREPRQRRSRDRYGRDRRDRAPRDAQAEGQAAEQTAEAQAPVEVPAADAGEQPARRSYFDAVAPQAQAEQAPVAAEVQAPVVAEEAVTAVAPVAEPAQPVQAEPAAAAEPQAAVEPVAETAAPAPQSQRPRHRAMRCRLPSCKPWQPHRVWNGSTPMPKRSPPSRLRLPPSPSPCAFRASARPWWCSTKAR
jgi:ribonuclease E